jgi:hypothetical protein
MPNASFVQKKAIMPQPSISGLAVSHQSCHNRAQMSAPESELNDTGLLYAEKLREFLETQHTPYAKPTRSVLFWLGLSTWQSRSVLCE